MPQLLFNTESPEFTSLDFNEVVLEAARSGELSSHLFILPTRRKLREIEREITSEHFRQTRQPIIHIPIHTFGTLAQALYEKLAPTRREISPALQIALMERAMKSVELDYYGGGERGPAPGVVEQITRVINGVRADGIMPSDFAADLEFAEQYPEQAEQQRFDTVKLRDLYTIYSQYLRLLDERWIDYPGKMLLVNSELFRNRQEVFRRACPGTRHILIYGFTEFTQPEIAMIQQLGLIPGLSVTIYFDYARENGPLYGNFDEAIGKLTLGGFRSIDLDPLQTDIPEEERRPFRHHMRRNLFRTDDRIENSSFDAMLNVYGFYNREEEVQGIAGIVKSLVIDDGFRPEEICITTYDLARYAGTFREHLAGFGIPSNITSQFPLDQSPLVTALLSAFNILISDYDRRDVLRAITSPYLDFGGQIDPAALTDASTRLRIVRGRRFWNMRIERRADYLRLQLARTADSEDRRSLETELDTLERAFRSMGALTRTLDEFDREMTPGEFRASFLRLIGKLSVSDNILKLRHHLESRSRTPQDWQRVHDEIERDTRALAELLRLIDELTEFLEIERSGSEEGEERKELGFYLDHLRTAATRSFYQIREKHDYGVLVTSFNQIPGLEFKVMIVCGLVDGEFPSTYIPETFLGKQLPDAQRRKLRRERVEFYQAITQYRQRLMLTYPRFAGDTALVRSSFLDAFLRITTLERSGRTVDVDELQTVRERIRRNEQLSPHLEFLKMIATPEMLAEEAGSSLWSGEDVPRIDVAEEMLGNLRMTWRVEELRYRAKAESDTTLAREYRGIIRGSLTPEEIAILAERRSREYSTTQLELYARCPFKYFAQRVLQVRAPASYDVTLTPLERGVMLHTVLFRLYTELRDRNELPITPELRNEAVMRARAIAREEIEGIVFDHPYWEIDKERLLGGEGLIGLLEEWIDTDIVRTSEEKSELQPMFFEVGFGGEKGREGEEDAALIEQNEIALRQLRLRGKVDRVEVFPRGDDLFYAVADYKTGQPPSRGDVEEGLSMQLMIYLEAIRHMLADRFQMPLENVKPVGGIYYQLRTQQVDVKPKLLFVPNELKNDIVSMKKSRQDPETTDDLLEIIDRSFAYAREYVGGIADGVFHVTTNDVNKVCRGCDYQSVCRVGEVGIFGGVSGQ